MVKRVLIRISPGAVSGRYRGMGGMDGEYDLLLIPQDLAAERKSCPVHINADLVVLFWENHKL